MSRIAHVLDSSDVLKILNKQWLNTKDIQKLACVGEGNARNIKKQISKKLLEQNWFLPAGLVPTQKVVEFLNIDVKYLKKIEREN